MASLFYEDTINVLRWNLRVVYEKICQETGKKIRERISVQKSAKIVHVTFSKSVAYPALLDLEVAIAKNENITCVVSAFIKNLMLCYVRYVA